MNHKSNRMLNDLKEIEKHLLNVASIEENEAVCRAYRTASNKLQHAVKDSHSFKAVVSNLKQLKTSFLKMKHAKLDDESIKVYRYAAHLVEDLITDYGTA